MLSAPKSHVILIHGLAAHRIVMQRLAWRLQATGYVVENWKYRSIVGTIPKHAQSLRERLEVLGGRSDTQEVHLVTHSMGSIIGRCALVSGPTQKLGRWVMLAPPNRGSHAARRLAPWLGWLCEPLIHLSDVPDSFVNRLGVPSEVEIGVLAAARDHVVPTSSTHLPTQRAWKMLPGLHSSLPWRDDAMQLVLKFLETGQF